MLKIENPIWTKNKPDYPCIFVIKDKSDYYDIYKLMWTISDEMEDNIRIARHKLTWCSLYNKELGNIEDLDYDEYLVIALLPSLIDEYKNIKTKK